MQTKLAWTSLTLIITTLLNFAGAQEKADITLTIDNRGATAFYLSATESESQVAELEADNTPWTLTAGQRYRIVNLGGAAYHPLELRGEAGVLLSQVEGNSGTFGTDETVAFKCDDEGITFTLTPELAQALTSYHCAYHPAMTGGISGK